MRKKSNLSLNRKKRSWRACAKEKKNYLSVLKSPLNSPKVTSCPNKEISLTNTFQKCTSPHRKCIKRKLTKSPFTPKSAVSRSKYLASPLPKRGKGDAARGLFGNALQDKRTLVEEDEFLPLNYITDCMENKEKQSLTEEIIKLAPAVMKYLSKSGDMDNIMVSFFRLVNEQKFPLENISFHLWAEVIKWFSCEKTCSMRYSEVTKKFWKLGWRLFGAKFIHFMSGYKNEGAYLQNPSASHTPHSSVINFAVPDLSILRSFDPYKVQGERKPGIFEDIIVVMSKNLTKKSACLTFDGKKIKQGLLEESGDVDLLGFEINETLSDKKGKLNKRVKEIEDVLKELQQHEGDLENINETSRVNLKSVLISELSSTSNDIFQIREIKQKKEYAKAKLIERGGESDWKKGKYVYAISAIIAFIHDIDSYLELAADITDKIALTVACLNSSHFVVGKTVNLKENDLYKCVDTTKRSEDTRFVKQRSDEWFEIRKTVKVTGSTIYTATGCDGLCRLQDHFDSVICGVKQKEPSEFVKMAMQHGTDNEENAVATIVGKVMPVFYPTLTFYEEGCVVIKEDEKSIIVVSPDGSLREGTSLSSTKTAVEIKCPVNKVHSQFPPRYLLQCLCEIQALEVENLLFVSWTPQETNVFMVKRDESLYKKALNISRQLFYDNERKPTKLNEDQKLLKLEIAKKSKEICLVARFSSTVATDHESNTYHENSLELRTVHNLLNDIKKLTENQYELKRERASEAMVFLVAGLDRSWEKNQIRSAPVCWFPKGYSLSTENLRLIVEEVHTKCHSQGIHIPCQSFDGQWHGLVTRTKDRHPLTILQLQKDVWREAEQKKKTEIIAKFKQMNKDVTCNTRIIIQNDTGISRKVIELSNGDIRLPRNPANKMLYNFKKKEKELVKSRHSTLADVIPDAVKEVHNVGDSILAMTSISEDLEMEIFESNIPEEEWASELERCQVDLSENNGNVFQMDNKEDTQSEVCPHKETPKPVNSNLQMETEDMECILNLFKATKDCNKKEKWNNVTPDELRQYFSSIKKLNSFLDVELRTIVRYLKKTKFKSKLKESVAKAMKVQDIALLLGLETTPPSDKISGKTKSNMRARKIKSLSELSAATVSKIPKFFLNIIYAEMIWPDKIESWTSEVEHVTVDGDHYDWFYKPEYSAVRNQYEVRCIDATHLLTRTRTKSCKGGLENLNNNSWMKVARSGKTLLTPVMIQEIVDPMSASMAITHFSEQVESVMRSNGDIASADLCRDVRMWWQAEDEPGISSAERHNMRMNLRRRLLSHVQFNEFPPPTMYVAGWPCQLWEAIIASIDAKVWLYSICHGGTYNVRAFSSMIGETFFSELTMNDRRGQGTVSCQEFGQFIGNTIEQVQIRLDPERTFSYRTKRTTVYNLVDDTDSMDNKEINQDISRNNFYEMPTDILFRDHHFDSHQRTRICGRRKEGTVVTERNSLQKGSLGVRWEKARCNQSKILPTVKMGIN